MVAASVIDQPDVTAGTTTDGLNTAKADATTSPGTCPSRDPRLQKYAEPSGRATPFLSAGLGEKPRRTYAAWHSGAKYTCPAKGSIAAASLLAFVRNSSSSIMTSLCAARRGSLIYKTMVLKTIVLQTADGPGAV
jgi:hypothetical protein